MDIFVVPLSKNSKTGPVAGVWIGRTLASAGASCGQCKIRPASLGGSGGCYAWRGRTVGALVAQSRSALSRRASPEAELRNSPASVVRFGVLGDPGSLPSRWYWRILRAIGSRWIVGYSHQWRRRAISRRSRHLLASCDDLGEADTAISAGWIPAAIVEPGEAPGRTVETPGGSTLVVCPEQRHPDRGITCATCRLCSPAHPAWESGRVHGIAFLRH
jgi:hypothetical protein